MAATVSGSRTSVTATCHSRLAAMARMRVMTASSYGTNTTSRRAASERRGARAGAPACTRTDRLRAQHRLFLQVPQRSRKRLAVALQPLHAPLPLLKLPQHLRRLAHEQRALCHAQRHNPRGQHRQVHAEPARSAA